MKETATTAPAPVPAAAGERRCEDLVQPPNVDDESKRDHAEALARCGRWDEALEIYVALFKRADGNSMSAAYDLMVAARAAGREEVALEAAEEKILSDKVHARVARLVVAAVHAEYFARVGSSEEGLKHYRTAENQVQNVLAVDEPGKSTELDGRALALLALLYRYRSEQRGTSDEGYLGIAQHICATELDGERKSEALSIACATVAYRRGDPWSGDALFAEVTQSETSSADAQLIRGLYTMSAGDWDEALVELGPAASSPTAEVAYRANLGIGVANVRLGQDQAAEAAYRAAADAIACDPGLPRTMPTELLLNLGVLLIRSPDASKRENGRLLLREYLRRHPDDDVRGQTVQRLLVDAG